jgi:hypothetical protein
MECLMDYSAKARIMQECTELVHRYTHYADLDMRYRVPELFTTDGVLAFPGEPVRGREALQAYFLTASPHRTTVHVCTNTVIDVLGPDEARGITYLTVYAHDDPVRPEAPVEPPARVGHYEDQFVRTPEGWRFRERVVVFRFGQLPRDERIHDVPNSDSA